MAKEKWRHKGTVKGNWATITIETNHFKLIGIITDAYDYAVKELNEEKGSDNHNEKKLV